MTAALLIDACGLSQREAAEFLNVRIDTVKGWYRPRPSAARPGVLSELRALHAKQRRAAAHQIALIRQLVRQHGAPDAIELSLSSDDAEARQKGWPCVGAERMTYAMVAARVDLPYVLAPRGSTPASAAAADAHENAKKPRQP